MNKPLRLKHKDAWILETQRFQRIARNGGDADSYDFLSKVYDEDQDHRKQRKEARARYLQSK